jgi:hypothetical protein
LTGLTIERVRDGFHRFYASIAAGFDYLPAMIGV